MSSVYIREVLERSKYKKDFSIDSINNKVIIIEPGTFS